MMTSYTWIAMAYGVVVICSGTGVNAQAVPPAGVPPVQQILSAFERRYENPDNYRDNQEAGWVITIIAEAERFGLQAMVDPVIEGLERLALSSTSPNVKFHSVLALASAGELTTDRSGLERADVVGRLQRIFQANRGASLVETAVLRRMAFQANRDEAARFLREVAHDDREGYRDVEFPPPYVAIEELSRMGDLGRAVLRELHDGGPVRNAQARAYLQWLSKRDFRRSRIP